jgi:3alpha(or 20beta)-hydroxysteroid dehydrogenase
MGKLDGKVALVTGGAKGMGASHCAALAAEGASVVVCDVLDEPGAAVAKEIGGIYLHLDVTSESDWTAAVAATQKAYGPIDILINNAGVVGLGRVDTTELDEWNRIIGINLTGTFLGIRYCAESMKKAGSGVIVNISSTAGLVGYCDMSAYVASKWGVRGLTKSAALDLGRFNIRVVSIHPGIIETDMASGLAISFKRQAIPRIGQSEEVAKLMLYLVSEATYSTGSEFVVDGGQTLGQIYDLN